MALRDPLSGELIRDGRWRGILGPQHEPDAYGLLTHTSPKQELELSAFLEDERHASFNLLTSNCSDFIGRALTVLFRERRYRTQSRMLAFSDSFITSPISLASNFVRFTKRNDMPLAVFFVPQIPGSRAKSEGIRTTTAGTLSPSFHQGLLAFGVKAYLLRMNLMVPALGFAADRLSFNVNLDATVNQKALPLPVLLGESPGDEFATPPTHADLVTYFGTSSCWGVRAREFKRTLRFSVDKGIIPAAAVRRSKTRLWPANLAREMEKRQLLEPASVLRLNRGYAASFAAGEPIPAEDVSILIRYLILAVNADLNRNALDRRSAPTFDRDWTFLTMTLTHLGYSVTPTPSVAACSSEDSNRRGSEVAHERAAARSFARTAGRGFRAALQGSIR